MACNLWREFVGHSLIGLRCSMLQPLRKVLKSSGVVLAFRFDQGGLREQNHRTPVKSAAIFSQTVRIAASGQTSGN